MASPLMASMAEKSVLFTAFDATHTYILPETMASQHKVLVAGAAGGFAVSFLLTPFELVKCKLQARDTYSGPLHCAREVCGGKGFAGDCAPGNETRGVRAVQPKGLTKTPPHQR